MKLFVCLLLVLIVIFQEASTIRWLSLQRSNIHWNVSNSSHFEKRTPCIFARRKYGLAKQQVRICKSTIEVMPHVQKAAQFAVETCQKIFEDRRWNCSSATLAPYLTPDLIRATREQAYVYAISSAALTYSIARACASGSLYHCTCASKPNEPANVGFQWGGCGDNLQWGVYFSKKFVDNVEKQNAAKRKKRKSLDYRRRSLSIEDVAAVNLHNNRVGRKIIKESLRLQCKCHGVSGSCNIKTCWKGLPPMIYIGQQLLKHYTNAREISTSLIEGSMGKKNTMNQLLYLSKSPDYCTKDLKLGSFGTIGRKCNVTSDGPNSCRQLCCGRGYRTLVEEKIERCHCKYYSCCYVKCKYCRTKTQIYECG